MKTSKFHNYRVQIHIDRSIDDSLMDQLATSIAMIYHRPVVQVSSNTLELSLTSEETDIILPSLSELTSSIVKQPHNIIVEPYDNTNWEREWKKYIGKVQVGSKFIVCPSWEKCSSDSNIIISIDPGMAFGTGHHETTRLCLEWIERFSMQYQNSLQRLSLLDVGTGSGILAIGAALVGFFRIVAIDNDPEAVNVAVENAIKNDVYEKIEFLVAEPYVFKGKVFDVTVANIQANILSEMAGTLVGITSGKLVLSGILRDQEDYIRSSFHRAGALWKETVTMGEWILMEFETGRDDWI